MNIVSKVIHNNISVRLPKRSTERAMLSCNLIPSPLLEKTGRRSLSRPDATSGLSYPGRIFFTKS
jgi:hypothetical protein